MNGETTGRSKLRGALVATVVAAAFAIPVAPASAVTCTVPSGPHPTITAAEADAGCDPIVVAAGTYTENLIVDRDVTIQGAGAGATMLDGGAFLALRIGANPLDHTVAMSGFSIIGTGQGVVILEQDIFNFSDSVVSGHSAAMGGGIEAAGTLNGTNLTISGNSTLNTLNGGAGIQGNSIVNLSNSTISGNHAAGNGGGLRVGLAASNATLTNVTFSNNSADGDGGGFSSVGSGATATFNNVTMAGNDADEDEDDAGDGGGIFMTAGTAVIRNSIVANNTDETPLPANGQAHDCSIGGGGILTRAGYVLVEDATGTSPAPGCVYGGMDTAVGYQTGVDPNLPAALGANGGPTLTLALNPGSVAINTGNPAVPGSGGSACPAADQRGLPRGGSAGVCDLGAFEVQPIPPVSVTPTPVPTTPAAAKKTKCKKKKKRSAVAAKKCKKKRR